MDGGAWTSILSAKFFGTSDPYTGRIINSRWVDLKVPYMTSAFYEEEGIDPDHTFFPIEEKEWYDHRILSLLFRSLSFLNDLYFNLFQLILQTPFYFTGYLDLRHINFLHMVSFVHPGTITHHPISLDLEMFTESMILPL